jgi:predicted ATPase
MRQGLATYEATGAELGRPYWLALPAGTYGKAGQVEKGLSLLTDALRIMHESGERYYEADLYRLKGELTRQHFTVQSSSFNVPNAQAEAEADACFHKAIEISRRQRAKSLELRATGSLARLWQQQGKQAEAHQVLSEIYGWFTEGFDTKDLQEAYALLEELS